jgi:hypothetical protein
MVNGPFLFGYCFRDFCLLWAKYFAQHLLCPVS